MLYNNIYTRTNTSNYTFYNHILKLKYFSDKTKINVASVIMKKIGWKWFAR
jgi:hypothetical protein